LQLAKLTDGEYVLNDVAAGSALSFGCWEGAVGSTWRAKRSLNADRALAVSSRGRSQEAIALDGLVGSSQLVPHWQFPTTIFMWGARGGEPGDGLSQRRGSGVPAAAVGAVIDSGNSGDDCYRHRGRTVAAADRRGALTERLGRSPAGSDGVPLASTCPYRQHKRCRCRRPPSARDLGSFPLGASCLPGTRARTDLQGEERRHDR